MVFYAVRGLGGATTGRDQPEQSGRRPAAALEHTPPIGGIEAHAGGSQASGQIVIDEVLVSPRRKMQGRARGQWLYPLRVEWVTR